MQSFQQGDEHTPKNLALSMVGLVALTAFLIIFSILITWAKLTQTGFAMLPGFG